MDDVVCVSGPPRSGTSLCLQMLESAGVPILTDGERTADENNPRGYYEYEKAKPVDSYLDWILEACGRAVKVVWPNVQAVPNPVRALYHHGHYDEDAFRYKVIYMRRDPGEVAESYQRFENRRGHGLPEDGDLDAVREWVAVSHDKSREWASGRQDVDFVQVDYNRLMDGPEGEAVKVKDFLGLDVGVGVLVDSVDPELYRSRA